jgi:putative CRISPR-associated protein (TIGR02619 family)
MRDVLLATVGTSVLTNFQQLERAASFEAWVAEQPEADRAALLRNRAALAEAAHDLAKKRWEQAAIALAVLSETPRVLGAEVASLEAILREPPYGKLREVVLFHSDTAEGGAAARFLARFIKLRFALETKAKKVAELRDDVPGVFRTFGLRQLVVELARAVREYGAARVLIDATGGYKAQVAIAVALGQVFQIPVVYRFERFPEIIELPPLPLALDFAFLEEHRELLEKESVTTQELERHFGKPLSEANPAFARFAVALAGPDTQGAYTRSPSGQLLLEALRSASRKPSR